MFTETHLKSRDTMDTFFKKFLLSMEEELAGSTDGSLGVGLEGLSLSSGPRDNSSAAPPPRSTAAAPEKVNRFSTAAAPVKVNRFSGL